MILLSFDQVSKTCPFVSSMRPTTSQLKVVNILEGNTSRPKSVDLDRKMCQVPLVQPQSGSVPGVDQHVLIESQPGGGHSANLRMKTLSHCIQTFFSIHTPKPR